MFKKIDNYLKNLYLLSGYMAAMFLVFVAIFILIGIASRLFGFYIRGLAEYSGYCMAASSFLALAYTFGEKGHIRITLFLEKASKNIKRILELWCFSVATFFSFFLSFYFIKHKKKGRLIIRPFFSFNFIIYKQLKQLALLNQLFRPIL